MSAVFAPEHGFRGAIDVDQAPDTRQETTRPPALPVYLLHDGVRLHPPTAAMLEQVDVLVVDLQDAGARYYTYPAAVATIMESAAAARLPVVVLDRPNPIGGAVQGDVQDSVTGSAVARLPIAMRHGMTIGELARLASERRCGLGADLHVVPLDGWRRSMDLRCDRPAIRAAEPESTHPRESLPLSRAVPVRGDQPVSGAGKRMALRADRRALAGHCRECWRRCVARPLRECAFSGDAFTPSRRATENTRIPCWPGSV